MTDPDHKNAEELEDPQVGDGAQPTREEAAELLRRSPDELAQLAVEHPAIASLLSVGFESIKDVWSGEQSANTKVGEAYFALTKRTIDGLFQRLDQMLAKRRELASTV